MGPGLNLQGEMAFPVAGALTGRSAPFVSATRYAAGIVPARFAGLTTCEKPFNAEQAGRAI